MLCVGLDPNFPLLPQKYAERPEPLFAFCRMIIDNTYEYAAAFKINCAFFEQFGASGIGELKKTCDYLKNNYPAIPLLLDAKRGDVSSTNLGYAGFIYDYLGADGATLHPYLGSEAMKPFLDRKDRAAIILCRTSNPGAGEFQDLQVKSKNKHIPLYEIVAETVVNNWNINGNCMLVVGATYPRELARVRKIAGDMIILVPGVGAQGGEIREVLRSGLNSNKRGLLINVGRAILYQDNPKEVAAKAKYFRDEINSLINY